MARPSPCSPRVDSLRPWSSPCAPGLVDTHPLTHPGSYGQCIATNAPAKGIVASPFHRFPRLAERPPGGAKEGLLALHRTDGGVWAAEVVGRCLRARPAARVKCASVRARRAVPRRLESRPSLSLFISAHSQPLPPEPPPGCRYPPLLSLQYLCLCAPLSTLSPEPEVA